MKTTSLKSPKVDIFPKGLTHGFHSKMAIFFNLFFWAIQYRKMSFMIFQQEKTPFQAVKTRSSNSREIDIFPKALTHGFGPKMAIFPTFSFLSIQARKMSFMIFQNKKYAILGYKKKKIEWRKIDIFQKGLTNGCCKKMAGFLICFFRKYRPGKCLF